MKKTIAYVIPGYGESAFSARYKGLRLIFRKLGYSVKPIRVGWNKDLVMSDYIDQVKKQVNAKSPFIVIGFSFGAFIASQISGAKNCGALYLLSLSPYFKEDLKSVSQKVKDFFGSRMITDLKKYSFPSNIRVPVYFYLGQKEVASLLPTLKRCMKNCSVNKSLDVIVGATHSVASRSYVRGLEKILLK